ncbi:MAG TPA: hypothetical protein VI603_19010 [Saprospiraceae bacterium]|nr:hypothetical protein [Saprospiraceae bacterium]
MKRIPIVFRLLATLPYAVITVYIFFPERLSFMDDVGIWHAIVVNVAYLLFVYYLYKRALRISSNKGKARLELLWMIFFNPYLIYYVWVKDDQLIKQYEGTATPER